MRFASKFSPLILYRRSLAYLPILFSLLGLLKTRKSKKLREGLRGAKASFPLILYNIRHYFFFCLFVNELFCSLTLSLLVSIYPPLYLAYIYLGPHSSGLRPFFAMGSLTPFFSPNIPRASALYRRRDVPTAVPHDLFG